MAKEKSSEIVSEEAEAKRRFEEMGEKVDKIFEHLKIGVTPPKEKTNESPPKEKETPPVPAPGGFKGFLQELGILSKD